MKNLTLTSNYNFSSGYGVLLKTLLDELPKKSLNIVPRTYSSISPEYIKYFENVGKFNVNDLDLCLLSIVNELGSTNPLVYLSFDRPRVLYTMWESTRVNDLIIEILNKFKCVIVPNVYNRDNFVNQGLNTKIVVLPLFCDTNFYRYKPHIERDKFIFGISNEDPRKNLDRVCRSFLKAFKNVDNVELHVKTINPVNQCFSNKIIYSSGKFSKEKLRDWYYNLDVYVSGATCEGWGMMQQESMCCGRPIIYTPYGGLNEFVSIDNGFQVKYEEVYSTESWGNYAGKWSEYEEDDMIRSMIYCFEHKNEVIYKGKLASEIASQYSKEKYIINLLNILNDYI